VTGKVRPGIRTVERLGKMGEKVSEETVADIRIIFVDGGGNLVR